MKRYRVALGNALIRASSYVKSYFDLQSETRKKQAEDLKDAMSRYCMAMISLDDLWHIASRREALDTEIYQRHHGSSEERLNQYLEIIESLGGIVMDFSFYADPRTISFSIGHLTNVIENKFGNSVYVDASATHFEVCCSHRMIGKLQLFIDTAYPAIQYETSGLDEPFPAGILNVPDAENWLREHEIMFVRTDYSDYIKAEPTEERRKLYLERALEYLEKTGMPYTAIIEVVVKGARDKRFPRPVPQVSIEIDRDGIMSVDDRDPKERKGGGLML